MTPDNIDWNSLYVVCSDGIWRPLMSIWSIADDYAFNRAYQLWLSQGRPSVDSA